MKCVLSLVLLLGLVGASNAGTTFLYGTTTDPSGRQADKFSVHIEGPTMFFGVRVLSEEQRPWLDRSLYLLNKDGTAAGGGHGYLWSTGSLGMIYGGIDPVPAGDYDLYLTSYANKAFDAAGNSLFGGLSTPGEVTYHLDLTPAAGPLDHFALDGPTPGEVVLGDYEIVFITEAETPEPASIVLLGVGIAGMAGYAWRRSRA